MTTGLKNTLILKSKAVVSKSGILKLPLLILLSGLLFFSCNQDSIFFDISIEPEPKDPRITGSPTNIVAVGDSVYTASIGSPIIHKYHNGAWFMLAAYTGINQLAGTTTHLYAILDNNTLYQVDTNTVINITGGMFQSVYGAGSRVFVGAGPGAGPYTLFCYDENSGPVSLAGIGGLLKGAVSAGNNYFIATSGVGGGIYRIDPSDNVTALVTGQNVMGIIRAGSYIIAITNNGLLYYFDSSLPSNINFYPLGETYTGAMCSWRSYSSGTWGPETLLLLGIRSTSMTHGYREIGLDPLNGRPAGGAVIPGSGSPSSVLSRARYEAAVGKHAVFSILQVPQAVEPMPGSQPVIFASTAKDGLWSLRNDQWNGEE